MITRRLHERGGKSPCNYQLKGHGVIFLDIVMERITKPYYSHKIENVFTKKFTSLQ